MIRWPPLRKGEHVREERLQRQQQQQQQKNTTNNKNKNRNKNRNKNKNNKNNKSNKNKAPPIRRFSATKIDWEKAVGVSTTTTTTTLGASPVCEALQ